MRAVTFADHADQSVSGEDLEAGCHVDDQGDAFGSSFLAKKGPEAGKSRAVQERRRENRNTKAV